MEANALTLCPNLMRTQLDNDLKHTIKLSGKASHFLLWLGVFHLSKSDLRGRRNKHKVEVAVLL